MVAKTGSKNDPSKRKMAATVLFNGEEVVPSKFIGINESGMVASYKKDQTMVVDEDGKPVWWSDVQD